VDDQEGDVDNVARIVVGVDGSDASSAALGWARREAARHEAVLEVVSAWSYPFLAMIPQPDKPPTPDSLIEQTTAMARRMLDKVEAEQGGTVETHIRAEQGAPAQVLLRLAEGADLLVVGARGLGGFSGLLLGSVSHQCVQHAPCPVVVVRQRPAS